MNGICAADIDAEFNIISPVEDLKVKNLAVHGFSGAGVFLFGTENPVIIGVHAEDNEEYGIASFVSTNGVYSWNVTVRNGEAGVYVGSSPEANAEIEHNVAYENLGSGIFLRDASNGEVEHNALWGNCIGILVLNTGENPHTWDIEHNRVNENNLACPAGDEGDAVSGLGIAVLSATDIDIEHNVVLGNRPGGETIASGGIVLVTDSTPLADIKVARNVAFGNDPFDILWDESRQRPLLRQPLRDVEPRRAVRTRPQGQPTRPPQRQEARAARASRPAPQASPLTHIKPRRWGPGSHRRRPRA